MASFPAHARKAEPFWIWMRQEMTGWQWQQLDHMEIICTLLQTNDNTSISFPEENCWGEVVWIFVWQMSFLSTSEQCWSRKRNMDPTSNLASSLFIHLLPASWPKGNCSFYAGFLMHCDVERTFLYLNENRITASLIRGRFVPSLIPSRNFEYSSISFQ